MTTTTQVNMRDVEAVVEELIEEYVRIYHLPCIAAINSGFCGDFADDLLRIFKDKGARFCKVPAAYFQTVNYTHLAHFWVVIGGLYVDAEAPCGVQDWRNLPFFQRARNFMSPFEVKEFFGPAFETIPSCLVE